VKYIIHFEVNENPDMYFVNGETIDEVRNNALNEMNQRGLDQNKNNMWSEQVTD